MQLFDVDRICAKLFRVRCKAPDINLKVWPIKDSRKMLENMKGKTKWGFFCCGEKHHAGYSPTVPNKPSRIFRLLSRKKINIASLFPTHQKHPMMFLSSEKKAKKWNAIRNTQKQSKTAAFRWRLISFFLYIKKKWKCLGEHFYLFWICCSNGIQLNI